MKIYKCDMNIILKLKKSCKNDIVGIIINILMLPAVLFCSWLFFSTTLTALEVDAEFPTFLDIINSLLNNATNFDILLIILVLLCDIFLFLNSIRKLLIKNNIVENLHEETLEFASDKIIIINVKNVRNRESLTYIEIPICEIVRAECVISGENRVGKAESFIKNFFTDPLISDTTNLRTIKIISKRGVFYLSIEESRYVVDTINSLVGLSKLKFF